VAVNFPAEANFFAQGRDAHCAFQAAAFRAGFGPADQTIHPFIIRRKRFFHAGKVIFFIFRLCGAFCQQNIQLRKACFAGGVQPGGVVLCIILFNTPVETFVAYSLNRMLDTGIGVLVSLIITLLLPHERMHRWFNLVCERLHIPAESVKRA